MLAESMLVTTIPVTDLDRAREFYRDMLGLMLLDDTPFALRFRAGRDSQVSVYRRPEVQRGHTVAHFEVADIGAEVADLRGRGVIFEEYTDGPLATTDGIARIGPARGAWFRDPDGNVLGLREGEIPG
jgi:catechol 2,3-dioxygenase-like lactoylglutathione lyase family enzyme